jgi:hypothetical protein
MRAINPLTQSTHSTVDQSRLSRRPTWTVPLQSRDLDLHCSSSLDLVRILALGVLDHSCVSRVPY